MKKGLRDGKALDSPFPGPHFLARTTAGCGSHHGQLLPGCNQARPFSFHVVYGPDAVHICYACPIEPASPGLGEQPRGTAATLGSAREQYRPCGPGTQAGARKPHAIIACRRRVRGSQRCSPCPTGNHSIYVVLDSVWSSFLLLVTHNKGRRPNNIRLQ